MKNINRYHQALTETQIKKFSSAFRRFDTDRDGNINGKDLGKILRHIGHNPTEAEIQVRDSLELVLKMGNGKCQEGTISSSLKIQKIREENVSHFQEMIANADKDGTGTLDIIEFLQMMKEKISEQNKEEEIGEAFRVFDIVSI